MVVPTVIVDVLLPLTWSTKFVPPPWPTLTVRVPPTGGVGVTVGPGTVGVTVGPGTVGVWVGPVGVVAWKGWSSAPTTKIGSVVLLSMTAA